MRIYIGIYVLNNVPDYVNIKGGRTIGLAVLGAKLVYVLFTSPPRRNADQWRLSIGARLGRHFPFAAGVSLLRHSP